MRLIGAGALAVVAGFLLYLFFHTSTPQTSDIGKLTLSLFTLGLFVYLVRVCSQQYRSYRHIEEVTLGKAASARTYERMVLAIDSEDIRSQVALAAAQSLFSIEDTGLSDGSGDQITMIERVIAAAPRTGS